MNYIIYLLIYILFVVCLIKKRWRIIGIVLLLSMMYWYVHNLHTNNDTLDKNTDMEYICTQVYELNIKVDEYSEYYDNMKYYKSFMYYEQLPKSHNIILQQINIIDQMLYVLPNNKKQNIKWDMIKSYLKGEIIL